MAQQHRPRMPRSDKSNVTTPSEMMTAANAAIDKIHAIIDGLGVSASDKEKVKRAIKENISQRFGQVIDDINSLQHQTTLAVPDTVGKELQDAVKNLVVDYYDGNREEFQASILKAFGKTDKANEVKGILERELFSKEKKLLADAQQGAKDYVANMHMNFVADSHNKFNVKYPAFPAPDEILRSPGRSLVTDRIRYVQTSMRRYWKTDYWIRNWYEKQWQQNLKQAQDEKDVSLAFGQAAINAEFFAFQAKKPQGVVEPYVKRDMQIAFHAFMRGDFATATGAKGKVTKPTMELLTKLNPLYISTSIIWDIMTRGLDKSQFCFEPRFETDPRTGETTITMPNYYFKFPYNSLWLNYPLKCLKRLYMQKAAMGSKPVSYMTIPEEYRKELVIWGIANCLYTADDLGLPQDHPWREVAENQRIKRSKQLGRAEHIDYKLHRPTKTVDVPELPATEEKKEAARIKADPAAVKSHVDEDVAARIRTPDIDLGKEPTASIRHPNIAEVKPTKGEAARIRGSQALTNANTAATITTTTSKQIPPAKSTAIPLAVSSGIASLSKKAAASLPLSEEKSNADKSKADISLPVSSSRMTRA